MLYLSVTVDWTNLASPEAREFYSLYMDDACELVESYAGDRSKPSVITYIFIKEDETDNDEAPEPVPSDGKSFTIWLDLPQKPPNVDRFGSLGSPFDGIPPRR